MQAAKGHFIIRHGSDVYLAMSWFKMAAPIYVLAPIGKTIEMATNWNN